MIRKETILEQVINGSYKKFSPPIWLLRQAGRYLEEYRKIRKTTKSFLDFCYDIDKASEVTIQPIKRFNFDAAIIFSDILVIPDACGIDVSFKIGEGPVLEGFYKEKIKNLNFNKEKLNNVYKAIKKVRTSLEEEKTLIGFAGAPWTLSCYIIEGGSSKDFTKVREFSYLYPKEFKELIYKLSDSIAEHLVEQVKNGANIIQIFDSWAGIAASGEEFSKWIIEPTSYIIRKIKNIYPSLPIIGFPRGAGISYLPYIEQTKIDVISIDYSADIKFISQNIDITIQGNLDPMLLKNNIEQALVVTSNILEIMNKKKFIFNLGHGILPETPVENVYKLVDFVKNGGGMGD